VCCWCAKPVRCSTACRRSDRWEGSPLTDQDRWGWLPELLDHIAHHLTPGQPAVTACSALKRSCRFPPEQSLGTRNGDHWPKASRWFFAIFFVGSSLVNACTGLTNSQLYVEAASQAALLRVNGELVNGFFSQYTTLLILLIAIGQLPLAAARRLGAPLTK
jgi:hypothetical protein